jgi:tRNA pseudouridine(55) synthase
MHRYVVIEKQVGQTPLQALEAYRATTPALAGVPMTYAGRLDPMASGALLLLIGDECKQQAHYHGLDKAYTFSVLFGTTSDTGDVLGVLKPAAEPTHPTKATLDTITKTLHGPITLPYPHYSAKTVAGKPLHTWALEGRLNEISLPHKQSTIYRLTCTAVEVLPAEEVYARARTMIDRLPTVTDPRKALGNDFRRPLVRESWHVWQRALANESVTVAHFSCIASSGTYMRSLAEVLATKVGTEGLALGIHRQTIGKYFPLWGGYGVWYKRYRVKAR